MILENSLLLTILAAQIVSGVTLSMYGNVLHFRKTPLMADALSHSVLPGLVMAYLFWGTKNIAVMIGGGVLSSLLATQLMSYLAEKKKFRRDVSIVVTYTSFFALGVFLLSHFVGSIDLDPDCVLFGDLTYLPFQKGWVVMGYEIPVSLGHLVVSCLATLVYFGIFGKILIWHSFDKNHFNQLGPTRFRLGLVLYRFALAAVLVVHFEILGSINVLTSLLMPPVVSSLLFKSLKSFAWGSAAIAVLLQIVGFVLSLSTNTLFSVTPGIVGLVFLIVFVVIQKIIPNQNPRNKAELGRAF